MRVVQKSVWTAQDTTRLLFLTCLLTSVSIAESRVYCDGLSWEDLIGLECFLENGTKVFCSDLFPVGTTLKYGCGDFYIPAGYDDHGKKMDEDESGFQSYAGKWRYATCQEDRKWSDPYFVTYRCDPAYDYCGKDWATFFSRISPYLKSLMIVICALSVITNLINVVVFTGQNHGLEGNTKGLTTILTVLSTSDLLFGLFVFISTCVEHYELIGLKNSYGLQLEILVGVCPYIFFHTWTTYLTILVGACQLTANFGGSWKFKWSPNPDKTVRWIILFTILVLSLPHIVVLLSCRIVPIDPENDLDPFLGTDFDRDEIETTTFTIPSTWTVSPAQKYTIESPFKNWRNELYLLHLLVAKLFPCTLILILIAALLFILIRRNLPKNGVEYVEMGGGAGDADSNTQEITMAASSNSNRENPAWHQIQNQADKDDKVDSETDRMVTVLLLVFFLTEFPDGVYSACRYFAGKTFAADCLQHVSNFVATLEVLSCLLNFAVFSTMSRNFRAVIIKKLT